MVSLVRYFLIKEKDRRSFPYEKKQPGVSGNLLSKDPESPTPVYFFFLPPFFSLCESALAATLLVFGVVLLLLSKPDAFVATFLLVTFFAILITFLIVH